MLCLDSRLSSKSNARFAQSDAMKSSLSLSQLAAVVLSTPLLVSAWPTWPEIFPRLDSLVVRQNGSK